MYRLLIAIYFILPTTVHSQSYLQGKLSFGYPYSYDVQSLSGVETSFFEGTPVAFYSDLTYYQQMSEDWYLSTGVGFGFMRLFRREVTYDNPSIGIERHLSDAIFEEYGYITVPIAVRKNIDRFWSVEIGVQPSYVLLSREFVLEVYTDLTDEGTRSERVSRSVDHNSNLNFIYRIGTDYRIARSGAWSHRLGLQAQLSDFGVSDDESNIFRYGEWAVSLNYRVALDYKVMRKRR